MQGSTSPFSSLAVLTGKAIENKSLVKVPPVQAVIEYQHTYETCGFDRLFYG